jgi:hypothetical protein
MVLRSLHGVLGHDRGPVVDRESQGVDTVVLAERTSVLGDTRKLVEQAVDVLLLGGAI